jgi:CRISPR-associated protein Cas1
MFPDADIVQNALIENGVGVDLMGKTIYLMSSGELKRKDNTIVVEGQEGRKFLPVEMTDEIMVFGEITLNKEFLEFATKNQLMLHFFSHYGYYTGTYYPREHLNSGAVIVSQVSHYIDQEQRQKIAHKFVCGAIRNMQKVLTYYKNRGKSGLDNALEDLEIHYEAAQNTLDISELMAQEGNARDKYYSFFDSITEKTAFTFSQRTRRPPQNRMNALISFLNTMCYILALSQIYRTHLDPRIGFLHEANFRRFSLNLDIAEIFKPILVDRLIFSLLNKEEIKANHFSNKAGGIYLNDTGREIVLRKWEERVQTTIEHPGLNRNVSYRRLVRMEVYKLEKHILGDQEYEPFITRW